MKIGQTCTSYMKRNVRNSTKHRAISLRQLLNSTQLNSTQRASMDAGVKHLNVHIYLVTIAYRYYNQLISRTDLSPIPVRSAANSYITSWCIQNLSKRVLNRQTVSTSTTKLGRLFQIRAEKEYFPVS